MKTLLKITAICLPLMLSAPSFAQISWGVDLRFGMPPPRHEVIVERPYPEAVWYPGYYNHVGYRYAWIPGRWNRPEGFREGWGHERYVRRGDNRDRRGNGGNGNRGRSQNYRHNEGRIK